MLEASIDERQYCDTLQSIITNLQVYSQCIYLDYLETKKFKGKLVKVRVWTLRFIKRPRKQ